jgi:hypothetical protein
VNHHILKDSGANALSMPPRRPDGGEAKTSPETGMTRLVVPSPVEAGKKS